MKQGCNYGVIPLKKPVSKKDWDSIILLGCKTILFLDEEITAPTEGNVEVVYCTHGVDVTMNTVQYGVALLRRSMPVTLITHVLVVN